MTFLRMENISAIWYCYVMRIHERDLGFRMATSPYGELCSPTGDCPVSFNAMLKQSRQRRSREAPTPDWVAERIRARRLALGLTLGQLSERAGLRSPSFVFHLERATRLPARRPPWRWPGPSATMSISTAPGQRH